MKEEEFTYVIDIAAKINAKVYSDKRLADISGTPKIFIWLLILAYIATFGIFITLYLSMSSKHANVLFKICYALLAGCLAIVVGVMIFNFCKK
jgi:nitrate/nitrite transporter NarK